MLICLDQTSSCDPLEWIVVDVPLPEGYGRIFTGRVQVGDLYFNRHSYKHEDGRGDGQWLAAWPVRAELDPLYREVGTYTCIIRPGVPSALVCERCKHQPKFPKERFCLYCGYIIVHEGRKRHASS